MKIYMFVGLRARKRGQGLPESEGQGEITVAIVARDGAIVLPLCWSRDVRHKPRCTRGNALVALSEDHCLVYNEFR